MNGFWISDFHLSEHFKLIAASIFVAFVLHIFFSGSGVSSPYNSEGVKKSPRAIVKSEGRVLGSGPVEVVDSDISKEDSQKAAFNRNHEKSTAIQQSSEMNAPQPFDYGEIDGVGMNVMEREMKENDEGTNSDVSTDTASRPINPIEEYSLKKDNKDEEQKEDRNDGIEEKIYLTCKAEKNPKGIIHNYEGSKSTPPEVGFIENSTTSAGDVEKLDLGTAEESLKTSSNGSDEEDRIPAPSPAPAPAPSSEHSSQPLIELHSSAKHPGLNAYYNWRATATSLYRVYAIPSHRTPQPHSSTGTFSRSTLNQAVLPIHPSSERGELPLYIEVTNHSSHAEIHVYWVDFKGNEKYKGTIRSGGGVWNQTTYIGHPWTFRIGQVNNNSGEEFVLLKYVPFRIIPSVAGADTSRVESLHAVVGVQRFSITDVPRGYCNREGLVPLCFVDDEILPEPPLVPISAFVSGDMNTEVFNEDNFNQRNILNNTHGVVSNPWTKTEIATAIQWCCHQIRREDAANNGRGISASKRLLQYLKNICLHPEDPKYRKLRTSNRIFSESIYNTGARGILLALGFEEHLGFLECGPGGGKILAYERIIMVSDAMMEVDRALKIMLDGDQAQQHGGLAQPEGSDGSGRAGFGHAGGLNL